MKERLNDLNYVIKTTDRRKSEMVCHVNMIKPYYDRQEVQPIAAVHKVEAKPTASECCVEPEVVTIPMSTGQTNSEIMQHLEDKVAHLEFVQLFQKVNSLPEKILHHRKRSTGIDPSFTAFRGLC